MQKIIKSVKITFMKNYKLATAMLVVVFASSCTKNDELPKNPVAINFTSPNLFPEGVVYDPFNRYFLVSSTTQGDVGKVSANGTYTPFITDNALVFTTGMEVDKIRKRLLVTNTNMANGKAWLAIYKLDNSERIRMVDLSSLLPASPHFANDVAVDKEGNAYVTDSYSPVIYKVDPEGKASIIFQNQDFNTPAGQIGFNGIEYHPDGFLLVSFSFKNQVVKIPLKKAPYSIVNLDNELKRPDGLLISQDGKRLIVVNNAGGTADGKVVSFTSNDSWLTGRATDSYSTGAVFPTTATTDGKKVYVLYAYLHLRTQATQNTFTIHQVPVSNSQDF